jgi:hypothetical protein
MSHVQLHMLAVPMRLSLLQLVSLLVSAVGDNGGGWLYVRGSLFSAREYVFHAFMSL